MTSSRWSRAHALSNATRLSVGRDISLAHECLGALIAAVHAGDAGGVRGGLENLHRLGERLDASELALWCAAVVPPQSDAGVEAIADMLPMLMQVWERTQHALVESIYPPEERTSGEWKEPRRGE